MPRAYYNEIEPYAAQWLRNLVAKGLIAPGEVDERSVVDVRPDDLAGYSQCHFFAGIGGWSFALRLAGWPDDRPVWTGSCPCQPFSSAGKGGGFDDERHLWPSWYWLINQCRPAIVFGEQVASKDAEPWLDLVQADLEALGYALGAVPFPSAGIGAPHIRDRLYWVADANGTGHFPSPYAGIHRGEESPGPWHGEPQRHGAVVGMDDAVSPRLEGQRCGHQAQIGQWQGSVRSVAEAGEFGWLADAGCVGRIGREGVSARCVDDRQNAGWVEDHDGPVGIGEAGLLRNEPAGPTNGLWRDADWLFCRDGKWRPVEPGTFPLAHGLPGRVGRLRAYGNAIVPQAAAEFIRAYLDCRP